MQAAGVAVARKDSNHNPCGYDCTHDHFAPHTLASALCFSAHARYMPDVSIDTSKSSPRSDTSTASRGWHGDSKLACIDLFAGACSIEQPDTIGRNSAAISCLFNFMG